MQMAMWTRMTIGAVVGGVFGFGWHKWVGCSTGACPIVANPYLSIFYGIAMGALAAGSFK